MAKYRFCFHLKTKAYRIHGRFFGRFVHIKAIAYIQYNIKIYLFDSLECKDNYRWCARYAKRNFCDHETIKERCRKSCGLCETGETTTTTKPETTRMTQPPQPQTTTTRKPKPTTPDTTTKTIKPPQPITTTEKPPPQPITTTKKPAVTVPTTPFPKDQGKLAAYINLNKQLNFPLAHRY